MSYEGGSRGPYQWRRTTLDRPEGHWNWRTPELNHVITIIIPIYTHTTTKITSIWSKVSSLNTLDCDILTLPMNATFETAIFAASQWLLRTRHSACTTGLHCNRARKIAMSAQRRQFLSDMVFWTPENGYAILQVMPPIGMIIGDDGCWSQSVCRMVVWMVSV